MQGAYKFTTGIWACGGGEESKWLADWLVGVSALNMMTD
jgi:hypothetical protein